MVWVLARNGFGTALAVPVLWGFPPGWLWGAPSFRVSPRVALVRRPPQCLCFRDPLWGGSGVPPAILSALVPPLLLGHPWDVFEVPSQEHPVLGASPAWSFMVPQAAPIPGGGMTPPVLPRGRAAPAIHPHLQLGPSQGPRYDRHPTGGAPVPLSPLISQHPVRGLRRCPHRVGFSLLGSPPRAVHASQHRHGAGRGDSTGGGPQPWSPRDAIKEHAAAWQGGGCWKTSKKALQPSWKKRINKERNMTFFFLLAFFFFKPHVSRPDFYFFLNPLASVPAGNSNQRGEALLFTRTFCGRDDAAVSRGFQTGAEVSRPVGTRLGAGGAAALGGKPERRPGTFTCRCLTLATSHRCRPLPCSCR